jgi:hypothetical protein
MLETVAMVTQELKLLSERSSALAAGLNDACRKMSGVLLPAACSLAPVVICVAAADKSTAALDVVIAST